MRSSLHARVLNRQGSNRTGILKHNLVYRDDCCGYGYNCLQSTVDCRVSECDDPVRVRERDAAAALSPHQRHLRGARQLRQVQHRRLQPRRRRGHLHQLRLQLLHHRHPQAKVHLKMYSKIISKPQKYLYLPSSSCCGPSFIYLHHGLSDRVMDIILQNLQIIINQKVYHWHLHFFPSQWTVDCVRLSFEIQTN